MTKKKQPSGLMKILKSGLLRVIVSFGTIALTIYLIRGEIHEAAGIMKSEVVWNWFFLSFFTYVIGNIILGLRMRVVFQSHHIHLGWGESLYLSFLGNFFNLFLPSAIGGDVAKAYYASKHTGKKIESMSAVLQDRLVGFVIIILMALAALTFMSKEFSNPKVHYIIYAFAFLMFFSLAFFFSKRVAKKFKFMHFVIPSERLKARIAEMYHAIYNFKNHPVILINTLVLSFIGQSLFMLVHYFLALSLGVSVNFWIFFLIVPVVAIVTMAPSVGGLGVREAGLIFFLKAYMPTERALVLSVLLDMIIYSFSFLCGAVYALKGGLKSKAMHEMEVLET